MRMCVGESQRDRDCSDAVNQYGAKVFESYEGHVKSSVTNRFPLFYPRYILKCFTALEWCVE